MSILTLNVAYSPKLAELFHRSEKECDAFVYLGPTRRSSMRREFEKMRWGLLAKGLSQLFPAYPLDACRLRIQALRKTLTNRKFFKNSAALTLQRHDS
jgi:hypothetical protein